MEIAPVVLSATMSTHRGRLGAFPAANYFGFIPENTLVWYAVPYQNVQTTIDSRSVFDRYVAITIAEENVTSWIARVIGEKLEQFDLY